MLCETPVLPELAGGRVVATARPTRRTGRVPPFSTLRPYFLSQNKNGGAEEREKRVGERTRRAEERKKSAEERKRSFEERTKRADEHEKGAADREKGTLSLFLLLSAPCLRGYGVSGISALVQLGRLLAFAPTRNGK